VELNVFGKLRYINTVHMYINTYTQYMRNHTLAYTRMYIHTYVHKTHIII
jgi:hypothetical protein